MDKARVLRELEDARELAKSAQRWLISACTCRKPMEFPRQFCMRFAKRIGKNHQLAEQLWARAFTKRGFSQR